MELRVAAVGREEWGGEKTSPNSVDLVISSPNSGDSAGASQATFGQGVYSLILLSEEGHLLLYRQIFQPETVSFVGKSSMGRVRVYLFHNRWIGLDSEMVVTLGEPSKQEEMQSQSANKQSQKTNNLSTNKTNKQSQKANKQSSHSSKSLPNDSSKSPSIDSSLPTILSPPNSTPFDPNPEKNDNSQDLLAFISWEDPSPHPPQPRAEQPKRPALPIQQPSKRANISEMESFLNSLFS